METVGPDAFRLAVNDEIVPHPSRTDHQRLPVMLYVTFYATLPMGGGHTVGHRFLFAEQPVKTAREILNVGIWLTQHAPYLSPAWSPTGITVLAVQGVEEELL